MNLPSIQMISNHNKKRMAFTMIIARFILLVGLLSTLPRLQAQVVDQFPADVHPVVMSPYSLFIEDYADPFRNLLMANIVFNDFNEPSWTFRLKLRIESPEILLETRPEFVPSIPIVVAPGEPVQVSGADWTEYIRYENLRIAGADEAFLNSGRLPEGNYRVTVQVLDYATGEPLSAESSFFWWMGLFSPPLLNLPQEDAYLNPETAQIAFNWQLFNIQSPNGPATNYQFTLYEVTHLGSSTASFDPLTAFQNGQLLEIYQSELLSTTSLVYGLAEPSLEVGKSYVYRVQALDGENRDAFKNNGYSEFRRFYYGWPTGGNIKLEFPEDDAGFSEWEQQAVRWSSPDNRLPGQPVKYELRIAEKGKQETPEQALGGNLWHQFESNTSFVDAAESHALPKSLKRSTSYAWEVIGYSSEQEIARSKQQVLHGPPLLNRFKAGTHLVLIDRVNDDPNNLIGRGKVRLTPPGDAPKDDVWVRFDFEGLKVELVGSQWILREGDILFPVEEESIVALNPLNEINGEATFEMQQVRVNKDGLSVLGDFHWYLHLPSFAEERAKLVTETEWFDYNDFTVTGYVPLSDDNFFRLLEPFGFTLDIDPTSSVFIAQNNYGMNLKGKVGLPEAAKGLTNASTVVQVPFFGQDQLFWMEKDNLELEPLLATTASNIEIQPEDFAIDFSMDKGIGHFADNASWMGLQLLQYEVVVPVDFDTRKQIIMSLPEVESVNHTAASTPAFVDSKGLSLETTIPINTPEQKIYLNTFPAEVESLKLVIKENNLSSDSDLDGSVILPLLNTETPFTFSVDIDKRGFSPEGPVWIDDLEGYRFTHNADVEEQLVNVTVKRAIFENRDHLAMVLDLDWPALDLSMEAVQDFKMWGNYNIGFYQPEGIRALDRQIVTAYQVYPYTVDVVTAGRSQGTYGFGVSGKIDLGEQVSGQSGLPSFNMYSIVKNPLLSGDYVPVETDEDASLMTETELEDRIDDLESQIAAEQASITQELDVKLDQVGVDMEGQLSSFKASLGGDAEMNVEEIIEVPEEEPEVGVDFENPEIYEKIVGEIIKVVSESMNDESQFAKAFAVAYQKAGENAQGSAISAVKGVPKSLALNFGSDISEKAIDPLKAQINKLDKKIKDEVDQITARVNGQFRTTIFNVVNAATEEVVNLLANKYPNSTDVVRQIGATVATSITQEIEISLKYAVQDNVTNPVSILLQDQLMGRIELYVNGLAEETVMAVFTPGVDPAEAFTNQLGTVDNLISDAGDDVAAFLQPANLLNMVEGIGADFVGNIDSDRIIGRIRTAAVEALVAAGSEALVNGVSQLTNQQLSEEAGVGAALAMGSIATQILTGGGLKKALTNKLEVKHSSKLFDFVGEAWLNEDHPIYGHVFSGSVAVTIKVPQDFSIDATYMNGRTHEGTKYWFVEVGGSASIASNTDAESDQDDVVAASNQMGEAMSDELQEPTTNGIKLGVAEIMAIRARLYKNMRPDDGELGSMVPDAGLKFGAYMHLVLFGPDGGNKLRLEVEGSVDTYRDGNLVIDFHGNTQLSSKTPTIASIDQEAAIQGTIDIHYNKHERHFFGYATVVLKTDGICGEGSLLVDVKPGKWRVALGNREDRLGLVPGCAGVAFYGWVDLNSDFVEVGFGMGLAFYKEFPFGGKRFSVSLIVDAGINANVFASVGWKPLQVREVGIFVELWARILAAYNVKIGPVKFSGSIELIDLYLYASSILRFNPKPVMLYGELKGHVRLLSIISFNFDKDYELKI